MNFELIILALISIFSLILLFKNFDLGFKVLLVLSVFLHKELFSIFQWDLLPVRFFMLALGVYTFWQFVLWWKEGFLKDKIIRYLKDPFMVVLVLLWLVRGISIIYSKNLQASLLLFSFFTLVIALGLITFDKYFGQTEKLLGFVKYFIYLTFVLTLFGYFQLFLYEKFGDIIGALWNVPGHVPRIGSTFWDVNHFGALLACLLPVFGVLVLFEKNRQKQAIFVLMIILMTGMLFLTSSRTAWITALVAFLTFLTTLLARKFGSKGLLYIFIALFLLAIPFVREYSIKSSPFRAYVKQNFHYRLDSFASHLMLLQGSYEIFEDNPIIGGGYGGFFERFRTTDIAAEFFGRDPAALNTRVPPHTVWGEALSETGVIGLSLQLISVLLILGVFLFGALKLKDRKEHLLLNAMFSSILGLHLAGFFYSYNSEFFWLILFLYYFLGLSMVLKHYGYEEIYSFFTKSAKFYLALVALISFVLIFSGLGSTHLVPWDEAIYAQIAKTMLQKGQYLTMYWRRPLQVWYEKPPLFMWMVSFFMNLLGPNSLAARLPSAVFGFSTVMVVFVWTKKMFNKHAAFMAALSLVTGIHFLYYSRTAMLDVTTTFFITLSLYLYWLANKNTKKVYWLFAGVSAGLAMMTKGVVGLFPLIIIGANEFILLISDKNYRNRKQFLNWLLLLLASLTVSLPWHLYMYHRFGAAFLNNYFLYHVISRATEAIEQKGEPFYWYLTVMKVSMRLWFVALIPAFVLFLYKSFKLKKDYLLVTVWFLVVLVFFSSATSKIIWYIMPLYPTAAIMVGKFLQKILEKIETLHPAFEKSVSRFIFLFLGTVIVLMYLFYNRQLVYTSDLTGPQADLLQLKDQEFGVDQRLYVDRVELPLVLFYTEGPFNIIDYEPQKGRAPIQEYDQRIVLLTKKSRFEESGTFYQKAPKVIKEEGDYVLFFYESDLRLDEERLDEINNLINSLSGKAVSDQGRVTSLEKERAQLVAKISSY